MRSGRRPRVSWGRTLSAALLPAVLVGGCSGLPGSGPVVAGQRLDVTPVHEPVHVRPETPREGAAPEDVVRGFIRAGDDTDETHAVAKLYLAPSSVDLFRWSSKEVVIYRDDADLSIKRTTDDQIELSIAPIGYLSPDGRYRDAAPGALERVTLGITQVTGEWRLTLPRDGFGIWLDARGFEQLYVSSPIHFVNRTGRELVPDQRWFRNSRSLATSVVRAQLGPVPAYLQGAVRTAVPPGTKLAVDAVPISQGLATVALTAEVLEAGPEDRQVMAAQLSASLEQVSVTALSLSADDATLELPDDVTRVTAPSELGYDVVQSAPFSRALLRRGTRLVSVDARYSPDREVDKPAPGGSGGPESFQDIPGGWQSLALSADGDEIAAVGGDRRELSRWPEHGEMTQDRAVGTDLTRPTYDVRGYLWFASADPAGRFHLWAIDSNVGGQAKPTMVKAPWLEERHVDAITVSRDGTRVLVVSTSHDGRDPQLHVAGVTRTPDGAPTGLAEPLRQAQPLTTIRDVLWLGPSSYAVLGRGEVGEELGPWVGTIGGGLDVILGEAANGTLTRRLETVPTAVSITTVDGRRGLRVITADGTILARGGSTWTKFAPGTELLVPGR